MPTIVTFGKSSPLAIICVPTRMRASPRRKRSISVACASLVRVVSLSMRRVGTSGKSLCTSSSTRCVPTPKYLIYGLPHSGQTFGTAASCPQ